MIQSCLFECIQCRHKVLGGGREGLIPQFLSKQTFTLSLNLHIEKKFEAQVVCNSFAKYTVITCSLCKGGVSFFQASFKKLSSDVLDSTNVTDCDRLFSLDFSGCSQFSGSSFHCLSSWFLLPSPSSPIFPFVER